MLTAYYWKYPRYTLYARMVSVMGVLQIGHVLSCVEHVSHTHTWPHGRSSLVFCSTKHTCVCVCVCVLSLSVYPLYMYMYIYIYIYIYPPRQ
jgi:hypothetical protein